MSTQRLFPFQASTPPPVVEMTDANEVASGLTTPLPQPLPRYKDQVRESQIATDTSRNSSGQLIVLPTFKQQMNAGGIVQQDLPSNIPEATAVPVVSETSTSVKTRIVPARCVGILLVIFVVAGAGAFGILCVAGRCRNSSTSVNASTGNADESSPRQFSAEELVALVNENSLWVTEIRYPILANKIGTPEQKALTWIVEDDELRTSALQVIQRYVLAAIWFQSEIPWDMGASSLWLGPGTHECDWERVTCNDDFVITELDLRNVNAHGNIPRDIALLSGLTFLRMDENMLSGALPSDLGLLTLLTVLELDQNQFSGSVPTEWQSLSRLTVLDLVNSGLSGSIESVIQGWQSLQVLALSDNQFTGGLPALPIPGSFVSFYGYLHNTLLEGSIPYCSFNNADIFQIQTLVADCDRVDCPCCTACCPSAMNEIPEYEYCGERSRSELIVNYINSITTSTVPLSYPSGNSAEEAALLWLIDEDPLKLHQGNFMQLQQRYALATLYFSGTWQNDNGWLSISNECGWAGITCTNAQSVSELKLTDADSGGTIPADVALLTQLRVLYLFNNHHTGRIPSSLGLLPFLEELELHMNRLSGSVPTEFGRLTALYNLSLFGNFLESTIPSELGNLSELFSFSLSDNNFTGTLPTSLEGLGSLQYVYLHNNDQLEGSLEFLCPRTITTLVADCDILLCPCCTFCCVEGGFEGIPEYGEAEGWCKD